MSRATVTTFGRGVSFVASGETGTQANEFEAAIKSVTSSITVGAVFLYDTRNDSDGGAWRKKCAGLSWYDEAASATRSARSEFPSVALIVSDSASGVTIYDLDDVNAPAWMVFSGLAGNYDTKMLWASGNAAGGGLVALNGRVFLGRTWVDFASDEGGYHHTSAPKIYSGGIGDRNGTTIAGASIYGAIANATVNDVAATIVEGSELGALDLPIPTIAVASDGGVSVIHPNGSVYDIAGTGQTHDDIQDVFFTDDGMVGYNFEASSSVTHSWSVALRKIPFADETIGGYATATNLERYNPKVGGAVSGLTTQTNEYTSSNSVTNAVTPTSKNGLAIGYADRLSIVKRNTGHMEEGAVAYVTSDYNTGYMLGDIRFAGLANSRTEDHSVKGNDLTLNGTVTQTTALGTFGQADATDLFAYSGFTSGSSGNHLAKGYDADFDFGTGDFSIMLWAKWSGSGTKVLVDRGEASRFLLYDPNTGKPQLYVTDGSTNESITTVNVLDDGNWHQIIALRRNSKLEIYVDGKDAQSAKPTSSHNLTDTNAVFRIGVNLSDADPFDGSLSLVRISATAPTPQQVKDIYEAEKPLFRAGAKCLITAATDTVRSLDFDKTTNILTVGQNQTSTNAGAVMFRGLERVDTFTGSDIVGVYDASSNPNGWSSDSIKKVSTAGGISAYARTEGQGGLIVDLPAIDVRGDINTTCTKLPDDGKLHFSGVTTDATLTTIGSIPIAEDETMEVLARVTGIEYQNQSSDYFFGEIKRTFYRKAGASSQNHGESSKLVNASLDSMDLALVNNATAETCDIKVTGKASTPITRMVWKAEVEVTRITEKTYER